MMPDSPCRTDIGIDEILVGFFGVILADPAGRKRSTFILHTASMKSGNAISRYVEVRRRAVGGRSTEICLLRLCSVLVGWWRSVRHSHGFAQCREC